jgi:hypothetical protein
MSLNLWPGKLLGAAFVPKQLGRDLTLHLGNRIPKYPAMGCEDNPMGEGSSSTALPRSPDRGSGPRGPSAKCDHMLRRAFSLAASLPLSRASSRGHGKVRLAVPLESRCPRAGEPVSFLDKSGEGLMVTPITPIRAKDGAPAPLDAMTIAAMQRQEIMKKSSGYVRCARSQKPTPQEPANAAAGKEWARYCRWPPIAWRSSRKKLETMA